jgi:hypothetical protein
MNNSNINNDKTKGKMQVVSNKTNVHKINNDPFLDKDAPIPLGYDSNYSRCYIWSKEGDTIVERTVSDLDKKAHLEPIIAPAWITKYGFDPEANKIVPQRIGEMIRERAKRSGIFSTDQEYGIGVYYDKELDKVVVNSRHECIDLDHNNIHRIETSRKAIYTKTGPKNPPKLMRLGNVSGDGTYTENEANAIFEKIHKTLDQWKLAGGCDGSGAKALIIGWMMSTCIVGALPARPSIWLVGAKGSGKTTLQDYMNHIVGGWVLRRSASDSSAAGIRQELSVSAASVILDEAEKGTDPDTVNRVNAIIKMMRNAYSATEAESMGTQDGKGKKYRLASSACYASIHKPNLQDQDSSRIAFISVLQRHKAEEQADESEEDLARRRVELKKEFRNMLKMTAREKAIFFSYSCYVFKTRYEQSREVLEIAWDMADDSNSNIDREMSTYGSMLALTISTSNTTLEETAKLATSLIKSVAETLEDSRKTSKEHMKLLDIICEHRVPIMEFNDRQVKEKTEEMSIGAVIVNIMHKMATGDIKKDEYLEALQATGLSMTKKKTTKNVTLDIPASSSSLLQILSRVNFRWKEDGSWVGPLTEMESAEETRTHIGTARKRCISIPVEALGLVDDEGNPVRSPITI